MMKYIIVFIITITFYSCELYPPAPLCNAPMELDDLTYENEEYKSYVVSNLKKSSPDNYRYFFKTFLEEDNQTMMLTNFRNENTCFDVLVFVDDWSKLEGMRKVNGESYPKELRNLTWIVTSENRVKYIDMNYIID